MKKTTNATQQKIYAIYQTIKQYTSKLRISSFIGGQFKKRPDTRLLKTMDDYKINFDLDSKIAWNRHRMREVFEMYKKIENYYPLFFGFLGFVGIYYFDFIIFLINDFNHLFLLTTSLTTIGLIWSLYYMIRIIFTNKWYHDGQPNRVYTDLFDQITIEEKAKNLPLNELDKLVRKQFLIDLEEDLAENSKFYSTKKRYVSNVLKIIVLTLIIYSVNIIHYKQLDTMAKTKKERVDEGNKSKTTKPLITEQVKKPKNVVSFNEFISEKENSDSLRNFIRQIIKEELKIKNEE